MPKGNLSDNDMGAERFFNWLRKVGDKKIGTVAWTCSGLLLVAIVCQDWEQVSNPRQPEGQAANVLTPVKASMRRVITSLYRWPSSGGAKGNEGTE